MKKDASLNDASYLVFILAFCVKTCAFKVVIYFVPGVNFTFPHPRTYIALSIHSRTSGATFNNQEEDLKMHVRQYTPKDETDLPTGAITIIGAHANDFPKYVEFDLSHCRKLTTFTHDRSYMNPCGKTFTNLFRVEALL